MLDKIYLYAVGIVLMLGLVLPFDVMAGKAVICINGVAVYGDGTCHNAVNNNNNHNNGYNRRLVLNGNDALHVLLRLNWNHGRGPTQSVDTNGIYYVVGRYVGNRYSVGRNRIFSCRASFNGQQFECNSWPSTTANSGANQ
jgi:hypothetical protein